MANEFHTTAKGINLIKHYEGLMLQAYKPIDTEAYYTIGYGHYGKDVRRGDRITQDYAEQLLREDLKTAEKAVTKLVKKPLTRFQFDALVSFVYNLGEANFAASTLLRRINEDPRHKDIRAQFLRWVYAGGRIIPGLQKRREAEWALYNLPCPL